MRKIPSLNLSVSRLTWPVWSDSRRADTLNDPVFHPVHKRDVIRFYHEAHALQRSRFTLKRAEDGKLLASALRVLETLVFDFLNFASGRLDPTYEQIAAKAGIGTRTVHRALKALRVAGVLTWQRRCIPDADAHGRFRLKQISNAYFFNLAAKWRTPKPPPPQSGTWGDHPSEGDALDRAVAAAAAAQGCTVTAMVQQLRSGTTPLEDVLVRIGEAILSPPKVQPV